ncbi:hypothetical protein [Acetobacter cibinongensis]|uniref:Uncharacterized protein n=1 Tax=Acetobacter cibinongensis TaxID=146475 RepID=A0A1Z5YZ96_9PROT|nr:hypothetical protein [Acetobacter cibinongensis]OUJ04661.1 hypothetical protein HK14_00525 [Acetobacter cibinongensis]
MNSEIKLIKYIKIAKISLVSLLSFYVFSNLLYAFIIGYKNYVKDHGVFGDIYLLLLALILFSLSFFIIIFFSILELFVRFYFRKKRQREARAVKASNLPL